jgi:hypothetical protein
MAGSAAYAGLLQKIGTPEEWGQGAGAYGRRFASTVGYSGIQGVLAFGLDSTLHHDPGIFDRAAQDSRGERPTRSKGTILTRTASGRETVSTWRLGSAYGAAFLSDQWYPDRLNTVRLGAMQGSLQLGVDFASNLGAEFLPDVKRKRLHHKASSASNDLHTSR